MTEIPKLSGPLREPVGGGSPDQLVVFLHGVGANGDDLIGLAPIFQRVLPDARFVSPNAPFSYDMAPFGYQWFPIGTFSPAERIKGVRQAEPILNAFIDAELAKAGLTGENLVLIGFSQGTMMALHVGLRRSVAPAAIIGYSGRLGGPEVLQDEIRCRPPVLLVHGDADPVLPVESLPEAEKALTDAGVPVEAHVRPGLGHGIDDEGIGFAMEFLARAFHLADD
jgi:phospholipase/carboxylesterase